MRRKPYLCILPMAASLLLLTQAACQGGSDEGAVKVFLARWQDAYNKHDAQAFSALYAPKGHYRVPMMLFVATSPEQLRQSLGKIWSINADAKLSTTERLVVGADDNFAFMWTLSVTDAKTKKPGTFAGATFMKLEDGLVKEEATVFRYQERRASAESSKGAGAKPEGAGSKPGAKPAGEAPKPSPAAKSGS